MKKTIIIVVSAFLIGGCVSPFYKGNAFSEWLGYEIGSSRPPPDTYTLVENEEYCVPWPLSECVYRSDSLSLAYHDGILISKEARVEGLAESYPLIEELSAAGNRDSVIQILGRHAGDGVPICYDIEATFYSCVIQINASSSEYLEARFSVKWDLISILFIKSDAL